MNPKDNKTDSININGIKVDILSYQQFCSLFEGALASRSQIAAGYANANTINVSFKKPELVKYFDFIDIVHPDGIGMNFASKKLNGNKKIPRFTGSDLYPYLTDIAVKYNSKIFFLGHDDETLNKIPANNKALNICGMQNGYDIPENIAEIINNSACDILIVGLGTPLQEKWLFENRYLLKCSFILLVGDGIKVFAGIKQRGPAFFRKSGLEWLYRFIKNPFKYFNRYIIGNPLFLYRIFRIKMRKLS